MIVRVLRAWTAARHAGAYAEYLDETVIGPLAAAPGSGGVIVLWRTVDDNAEFLVLSLWRSQDDADAFAASVAAEPFEVADDELYAEVALAPDDYQFFMRGDIALGAGLWGES